MISVDRILMDHLSHPLGLEKMPVLTWTLRSDGRNVRQTAFQWQLTEDETFLLCLHDTGRVESDRSVNVPVPELPLKPLRTYFLKVRVWAGEEESPWSAPVSFVTGLPGNRWQAHFITAEEPGDWSNSGGTFLRRSWRIEKPLREAYLCATALGLYRLTLNGKSVGEERMLPGWTSYRKHLCYQTWCVTSLLRPGENVLGASLGAGWYKGMMGFIHERCSWGDRTALLAQLILRYEDGTEEVVLTDENWLGCASPVTFSEIYDGERYDARLEQPGWDLPGFTPARGSARKENAVPLRDRLQFPLTDGEKEELRRNAQDFQPSDTLWRPVKTLAFPLSVLASQPGCRPVIEQTLPVRAILTTPKGENVLDFGQNLTGFVRFTVRGREDALCHLRCFETLDASGNAYFDNLRGALAEIRYVCRDDRPVTYEEQFSFQGFRYALVAAWPEEVRPENFTACVICSDMPVTGHFECSEPLVNQLQHNIEWSMRGNFLDVPTDCPQRDERMGWTGDAQIFAPTAAFLRDTLPFFRKWLRDVALDQTPEGGVPHIVPNQLQYFRISDWLLSQGTHSAAGWADVAVILPWTLYLTYGDTEILVNQFDSMKAWIDFMRSHAEDYIWNYKLQFGDWVALDAEEGSFWGATPNDLTCTAWFARSTELFVKICYVLGREALAREYEELYRRVTDKFRRTFLDERGVMTVQTQTAHILALYFGLVPQNGIPGTVEGLLRLLEKENGHLVTGFAGTPYFCYVLSENGHVREAYDLLLRDDFPSWLYQMKAGATTVWEHWDGLKPDGTMWSPAMNSFNHYAYGAVGDWLYRVVVGLRADEADPGYHHAIIAPLPGDRLTHASASLETGYGTVKSAWERQGDTVTLRVQVPVNAAATIILEPGAESPESDLTFSRSGEGRYEARAGSGAWTVTYRREKRR